MSLIKFSCGMCGCPIGEDGSEDMPIPEGYNPNDYEHTWCTGCAQEAIRQDWEDAERRRLEEELWHKENDK